MQGRPPSADVHPGRRQHPIATFAAECGLRGPLRFMVENTESGQSQTFDVVEPFVLIGQSPGCHLRLMHPDVSFRHAYCQVIQGRLYVYDLDTEHGTVWGAGIRREGPLTPDSRLQIGPFIVRLSRAPAFTCSLQPTPDDWEPENEPLESVRLWFENATGRSSHSALRPLRRQITLLGRSNRCHLKLSDASVSKAHCAIVRTEVGLWVIDLLGRTGTTLNSKTVRFASIGPDDSLGAGRFRMKVRELVHSECDEPTETVVNDAVNASSEARLPLPGSFAPLVVRSSPVDAAVAEQHLMQSRQALSLHASKLPDAPGHDAGRGTSDALILAMMEQFSNLQQQLLSHTQQQMSMLTEMFATLHKAQNDAVMDQLQRIQAISSELNALKAEKIVARATVEHAVREAADAGSMKADDGETLTTNAEVSASIEPHAQPDVQAAPATVTSARSEAEHQIDSASGVPQAMIPPPPNAEAAAFEAPGRETRDQRPDEVVLPDDSDVVPVPMTEEQSSIVDDVVDLDPEDRDAGSDEQDFVELQAPAAARPRPAVQPRHDATAHARLTMRISELERERKSRWKKLMQLVGGARTSEATSH